MSCCWRRVSILLTAVFAILFTNTSIVHGSDDGDAEDSTIPTKCESEEDLDFENCNVDDLSVESLKAICERIDLDVETDIFSYIFDDDEDKKLLIEKKQYSHEDYVAAAYECLMIEYEVEENMSSEELTEEELVILRQAVGEAISNNKDASIWKELEDELKEDHETWQNLVTKGLLEGESLTDKPDILTDLLVELIAEDPSLFEDYFGETDEAEGFSKIGDDADSKDEL